MTYHTGATIDVNSNTGLALMCYRAKKKNKHITACHELVTTMQAVYSAQPLSPIDRTSETTVPRSNDRGTCLGMLVYTQKSATDTTVLINKDEFTVRKKNILRSTIVWRCEHRFTGATKVPLRAPEESVGVQVKPRLTVTLVLFSVVPRITNTTWLVCTVLVHLTLVTATTGATLGNSFSKPRT